MGNRRLGRKRLYAVNKLGQTNANAAGAGIADAIVSNTVRREGHKIITEIVVDLGTSKATIASSTTDLDVIGVSGGGNAALTQLTPAVNGYLTYAEMACVEAPVTGVTSIDLYIADEGTSTQAFDRLITDDTETAIITADGAWTLGAVDHYAVAHGTAFDLAADSNYVYLVCGASGTAANYSAGKFVITFEGYAAPDDI